MPGTCTDNTAGPQQWSTALWLAHGLSTQHCMVTPEPLPK